MKKRNVLVILSAAALVLFGVMAAPAMAAYAAPPAHGPPGLAKAVAAQMKHNPQLLTTPGVVGTAVALEGDGLAVVKVFTERPGVVRLPLFLDGVPVVVQVTGKLMALGAGAAAWWNSAPVVTISSPVNGASYPSGASINFAGTARDREDGDISAKLVWNSNSPVYIGTGASIDSVLPDGTHTITASVTDKGGKTGRASVTIIVGGTPGQTKTTDKWTRPVPIGVSTGNYQDVSAGTIACRVVDAANNVYALSNTHVFAPRNISGSSEVGDIVTQPGLYDAPGNAYNSGLDLGRVSAYKPINGSIFATNDIDAAIALTDSNKLGTSTPTSLGGYGVPNKTTKAAALNMAVQKFGRTTLLTKGTITGINATMAVGYANNWYAWFSGQIIVQSTGAFVLPGDSGSLVVTDDASANPVGLLFAGNSSGTMAIVNPIDKVLAYFKVTIDGK